MKIFSASKLNTCIIEYYISYIENIKIIKYSEPLFLGNLLHKGLELYVSKKYVDSKLEEEFNEFNRYIDHKDIDRIVDYFNTNNKLSNIYEKIYDTSYSNCNIDYGQIDKEKIYRLNIDSVISQYKLLINKSINYIDSIISKYKYNKISPEEFIKIEINTNNKSLLYGILDLIIYYDNKLSIIDYKISKNEASKFQIYFYGYLVSSNFCDIDNINLFYIYPKLNKITHVNVNKKTMTNIFEPFLINKINSLILLENVIEPIKLDDSSRNQISIEIQNLTNEDIDANQRYIANKYNIDKIINNINVISALITDSRISKINNPRNAKCLFCDYKKICKAKLSYPSMLL